MTEFVPGTNVLEVGSGGETAREDSSIPDLLKPLISCCLDLNHTVNNPLAGILGFCELLLLEDDPLSAEQRDMIEQLLDCAERIKTQIDRLGDLKMELSRKVPMDELIGQVRPETGN